MRRNVIFSCWQEDLVAGHKRRGHPIVFLKSAMRTRGSERASREAKAVQWRTFRGGIENLVKKMKRVRISPIMLGRQNHLWVRRPLPRSWSRTNNLVGGT